MARISKEMKQAFPQLVTGANGYNGFGGTRKLEALQNNFGLLGRNSMHFFKDETISNGCINKGSDFQHAFDDAPLNKNSPRTVIGQHFQTPDIFISNKDLSSCNIRWPRFQSQYPTEIISNDVNFYYLTVAKIESNVPLLQKKPFFPVGTTDFVDALLKKFDYMRLHKDGTTISSFNLKDGLYCMRLSISNTYPAKTDLVGAIPKIRDEQATHYGDICISITYRDPVRGMGCMDGKIGSGDKIRTWNEQMRKIFSLLSYEMQDFMNKDPLAIVKIV